MENKIDSKTICCSCSHKFYTGSNYGELSTPCERCNGKNYLLPIDFGINCRECTTKVCIHNNN